MSVLFKSIVVLIIYFIINNKRTSKELSTEGYLDWVACISFVCDLGSKEQVPHS